MRPEVGIPGESGITQWAVECGVKYNVTCSVKCGCEVSSTAEQEGVVKGLV